MGGNVKRRVRVAVTGAAGQIGYALLFRIASGQMFGPETDVELSLLELESALGALGGIAMELEDCAFPLLKDVRCGSDVNAAMRGVNWALLVGAIPRKADMQRSDLLRVNGGIFTRQGRAINDHAAEDVRVFVVGNPANTNCYIAMRNAPRVPQDRFFAMTSLDELRARAQLAKRAGAEVGAVSQMAIWGNHSATQFPDFTNALIGARPAGEVIGDRAWLEDHFISTVQNRGTEVIKARGASSAASAANAAIVGVYNLTHDTPANEWYSVARVSHGEYGVDPGLIFSFPSFTQDGVSRIVEGVTLDEFGKRKLAATLEELRTERDTVEELGLTAAK
ncbi:MAG: malate dehydrogenase [Candidatus Eremiobacteraeota bacterium]|nr:malate dehydrogenase [Candidatus Eremiobacteraeota bacterium]